MNTSILPRLTLLAICLLLVGDLFATAGTLQPVQTSALNRLRARKQEGTTEYLPGYVEKGALDGGPR